MCNPTLVVSAVSAGLQYQQSIQAQKAQRDAQIRQNEIAKKNLENRRTNLQAKLIQKTKKNLKVIGLKEKEATRKKAKFLASERGFTGNTYNFLLGNYDDRLGNIRSTILGNINFDANAFRNDYLNLNTLYDSQTSYVTNVDYGTTGLVAGLNYSKSYLDYKNKQSVLETNTQKYSYEQLTDMEDGIT